MLSENAGDVCQDPRLIEPEIPERDGVWNAFNAMWFFYDTDSNGFVESHDIRTAFNTIDFWSSGKISR
jgi:hypothetical protein